MEQKMGTETNSDRSGDQAEKKIVSSDLEWTTEPFASMEEEEAWMESLGCYDGWVGQEDD